MRIGGLLRTSFSDYPALISAVVFTRGCNFDCPFCHNPDLVVPDGEDDPGLDEVLDFLQRRKRQLEGVVISGGEPLLQSDLADFLRSVREMGYAVKLDTNGSLPRQLMALLAEDLVDYVAMDVKAPLERYEEVTGAVDSDVSVFSSVRAVIKSGVDHEFRTTLVRPLLGEEDVLAIGPLLRGCHRYVLQPFVGERTLDPTLEGVSFTDGEMADLREKLVASGLRCELRRSPTTR